MCGGWWCGVVVVHGCCWGCWCDVGWCGDGFECVGVGVCFVGGDGCGACGWECAGEYGVAGCVWVGGCGSGFGGVVWVVVGVAGAVVCVSVAAL